MNSAECIATIPEGWRRLELDETIQPGDRGWLLSNDSRDNVGKPDKAPEEWGWDAWTIHGSVSLQEVEAAERALPLNEETRVLVIRKS